MAGTATPIFPQTVKNYSAQILPADTTAKKTLVTGATNGTKIEMINIASTDTAAKDVQFWMNNGSVDLLVATIAVPANSGNTNALAVQGLLSSNNTTAPFLPWFQFPLDNNGNRYLMVSSGYTLKAAVLVAVTAAKEIDILCQGGDF
jgi:hypothetical protein